ncbi:hypothetical protein [Bacillus sp. 1P02SD]|uniref:hypothetical protein n=1 Tax=Bacillus sp. 1P02SD TaxID=3132264 RepID=UPI0039A0154A
MKVNIDVFLDIEGSKLRSGGAFDINPREYKNNPDLTVAIIAYQYIQDIIKQTGYRETLIKKVLYEGNKDITELTRQIRRIPPKDDLPF